MKCWVDPHCHLMYLVCITQICSSYNTQQLLLTAGILCSQNFATQQICNSMAPSSTSPEASSSRQLGSQNIPQGMSEVVGEQAQLIGSKLLIGSKVLMQRLADMISCGARHVMIIGGPGMVHLFSVMHVLQLSS